MKWFLDSRVHHFPKHDQQPLAPAALAWGRTRGKRGRQHGTGTPSRLKRARRRNRRGLRRSTHRCNRPALPVDRVIDLRSGEAPPQAFQSVRSLDVLGWCG